MTRLLPLAFLLFASVADAQRHPLWTNRGLSERGIDLGEQQMILRQDLARCHGSAFEQTRGLEGEEKRKSLGVAVFNRCMEDKGWAPHDPGRRKAPARKETAA